MNAELRRHLDIELLQPSRLFAMPSVLGSLFLLTWLMQPYRLGALHIVAEVSFYTIVGVWGTRRAANGVLGELSGGTWHWQRLSALTPGRMVIGKLFGETAFTWYGGVLCLAVMLWIDFQDMAPRAAVAAAVMNVGAVLAGHLVALICGLILIYKDRTGRPQLLVTLAHMAGMATIGLSLVLTASFELPARAELAERLPLSVTWYGLELTSRAYGVAIAAQILGWGLVGAVRLMRREMRHPIRPWLWPLFCLWVALWAAGYDILLAPGADPLGAFGGAPTRSLPWSLRALLSVLVLAMVVYLGAASEPKSVLRYRRLGRAREEGHWHQILAEMPLWPVPAALTLAGGLCVAVLAMANPGTLGAFVVYFDRPLALAAWPLAVLFFLIRDVAILHLSGFSRHARTPDLTALVFLLLTYTLLPFCLHLMEANDLIPFLLPRPQTPPEIMLAAPFIEAVAAAALVSLRWRHCRRDHPLPPVVGERAAKT